MPSRKRKASDPSPNAIEWQRKYNVVTNFWSSHYIYKNRDMPKIMMSEVFKFLTQETGIESNLKEFHGMSHRLGVKVRKGKDLESSVFFASPLSHNAMQFHSASDRPPMPNVSQGDFHLLNVQGLITNKINYCSDLRVITWSKAKSKIIAITESHLYKKSH